MMQYRKFGRLDWQASVLGFGCMRFPTIDNDPAQIDEPEASRILYYAIDMGLNYLDTAYSYHREQSESFLGRVLQGSRREKVRVATKLPHWKCETSADYDRYLTEQLQRLNTDRIDFYLVHGMDKNNFKRQRDMGLFEWLSKPLADGRVGSLGFSFHDDLATFTEIIASYDWDFCQVQYNYMDYNTQPGTEGVRYAASKNLAVIVMEPLLGGRLVHPPEMVAKIWDSAAAQRSPVEWSLHWLWSQPEVTLLLSGMNNMLQVEENLRLANQARSGLFSSEDWAVVERARSAYNDLCLVNCTGCNYCQPCPNEINIPLLFELYNSGHMYGAIDYIRQNYPRWIDSDHRADHCLRCGECETKCPQHLPICDLLADVDTVLGQGKPYPPH
jgi:uncharacterized protein